MTLAVLRNQVSYLHVVSFSLQIEPMKKRVIFKDTFPGLSKTLSLNFHNCPCPGSLKKKSKTLQEAWKPLSDLTVI